MRMNEVLWTRVFCLLFRLFGYRCALTFSEQVAEHMTDFDDVARFGAIERDAQNAAVDGFDLLRGFVAFEREEWFAFFDEVAILLQPREELPFLHRPAEPGQCDVDGHGFGLFSAQFADGLRDGFSVRHHGGFKRGAVRRGRGFAVEAADGSIEVVKAAVG